MTSPPYYSLRDYGIAPVDWPEVHHAPLPGAALAGIPPMRAVLGLEPTVEAYVGHLVLVFRAIRRTLREDATAWLNLGDAHGRKGDPNLLLVPSRVALALQADGWIVRSDVVWAKPNPLPESITNRPTRAHESVFLLALRPDYFYDHHAIMEAAVGGASGNASRHLTDGSRGRPRDHLGKGIPWDGRPLRNLRTVWEIVPRPAPAGQHFAVFPPELPRRAILAGTSERGCCPACGAPWRRVVERKRVGDRPGRVQEREGDGIAAAHGPDGRAGNRCSIVARTAGWKAGCRCEAGEPVPCVVLDPFGGSGTTGEVAFTLGRHAVLCEASADYVDLIRQRLGRVAPAPHDG